MICEKCKINQCSNNSSRFCSRACANSRHHSEETKQRIAQSLKGRKMHPNTAKAVSSEDSRAKASLNRLATLQERRKFIEATQPVDTWKAAWIYEYVIKRAGGVCEECKLNMRLPDGRGPYEIHHIDGNRKNNSVTNLQYLCLICHWKTDNYRFKGRSHSNNRRIA